MMAKLLGAGNRQFEPVLVDPLKTQGATFCGHQRLFVRNNSKKTYDCHPTDDPRGKPFYSLPLRPHWEDAVIVGVSDPTVTFAPNDDPSSRCLRSQEPLLISLRKNNQLTTHLLKSGATLQSWNLGPVDSANFQQLHFDDESGQLWLKSTRQHPDPDVLLTFLGFQVRPWSFLARFVVRKSAFGRTITDADVVGQMLMVLETKSLTRVYALSDVLDVLHGRSGDEEKDILTNLELPAAPKCLAAIKSYMQYIQLSPLAKASMVYCDGHDLNFKIKRLIDDHVIACLGPKDFEGQNFVGFHMDDSARVISVNGSR